MTAKRRRRRFQRRRWPAVLVLVIVALLILADRQGWLLVGRTDELSQYHGRTFVITRVIDGDTIEIEAFDRVENRPTTRVRLWGIDCPEAARPGQPVAEPWADEATALMTQLSQAGPVTLLLETSRLRGRYGRVLAHVDAADGRCINELLLDAGLAEADDRWTHGELQRYAAAERRAKDAGLGIWSD